MAVHPTVPEDVPSLVEAYRQTLASFADVADGFREQDWSLPTACPGWNTRAHLAHVHHLEDYLSGSEHPISGWADEVAGSGEQSANDSHARGGAADDSHVEIGSPAHVQNRFGVWIEEGVRARSGRDPRALTADLRGLIDVRAAQMYDPDLALDTPVRGAVGRETTFENLTRMRMADVWVHEQDLREAVNRPGSLDSPGASIFTDLLLGSLADIVITHVRPEPGTVVILESTGPVLGRAGVRVGTDADGELIGHELFSGHTEEEALEDASDVEATSDVDATSDADAADTDTPDSASEHQVTNISLSTYALTRRGAGRVSTQDTAYHVVGDEDLARRVLDALAVTP
ncbi:maleylpyruvate isomerase family mycothiol-dependent enzyme [Ornithinimicrobium sp. Y1694]|uniref:maleylpyruvate isomerase family mycothiol-dependent enzyme n=1 Tax=Ornithinimicrobium sp. Y1694 TaxID=3418590 RepID=UPI003CFA1C98